MIHSIARLCGREGGDVEQTRFHIDDANQPRSDAQEDRGRDTALNQSRAGHRLTERFNLGPDAPGTLLLERLCWSEAVDK